MIVTVDVQTCESREEKSDLDPCFNETIQWVDDATMNIEQYESDNIMLTVHGNKPVVVSCSELMKSLTLFKEDNPE